MDDDMIRLPMAQGVYIMEDDHKRATGIVAFTHGFRVEVALDRVQMRAFAEALMRASAPPVTV